MFSWIKEDLEAFDFHLPKGNPLDDFAAKLGVQPCTNSFAVVLASALLFYKLEKGHNSKVNDIYDAMIYTSTCMSVGYGEIFARTPGGKIIGTLLMTLGPSLVGKALSGHGEKPDASNTEIVQSLQKILEELKKKV
jgi:hypothetical protein